MVGGGVDGLQYLQYNNFLSLNDKESGDLEDQTQGAWCTHAAFEGVLRFLAHLSQRAVVPKLFSFGF